MPAPPNERTPLPEERRTDLEGNRVDADGSRSQSAETGETLAVHPAAAVWPQLSDDEFTALAISIVEVGLLEPIVVTPDGELLDGVNRLFACRVVGVEPTFKTYDGDPVEFVLARNLYRRHLSKGQRAMAAFETAATASDVRNNSELARRIEVDEAQVRWARTVHDCAPDLVGAVISGATPLREAYETARKRRAEAESLDEYLARLPSDIADLLRDEEEPGILDLYDDVSNDEFEAAITNAKAAGDLSRANLVETIRRTRIERRIEALPPDLAERVRAGDVDVANAERDVRERSAALRREVDRVLDVLHGWSTFSHLRVNARRAEILDALDPFDRDRVLELENELLG